jgi:hypothetical protein
VLGDGHLIAGGFDGYEDLRCATPFVATTTAAVMIINKVKQAYGKIIA